MATLNFTRRPRESKAAVDEVPEDTRPWVDDNTEVQFHTGMTLNLDASELTDRRMNQALRVVVTGEDGRKSIIFLHLGENASGRVKAEVTAKMPNRKERSASCVAGWLDHN